jgi:hypothetical protein
MRPTRQRSTTGTLPITCHGRSTPSERNEAGGAGAARARGFYGFADVEEARELSDSDKIKPLIADLDRVWATGYLGGERSWRLFRR